MYRKLTETERAVTPGETFDAYPPDSFDGWGDLDDASNPTFAVGAVVAVDTPHGPRRALVVGHGRERSHRTGDWIGRYILRPYRRDGSLGEARRLAYPGDLARGFAALAEAQAA
jgi:hypothetical protein